MMDQKPLMLKDYLEQDSGSESSSSSGSGFRCAPRRADDTVRCLLEAELRHGGGEGEGAGRRQLVRGARSKSAALMKLSSVINVVKLLSFSSTTFSSAAAGRGGRSGGFSKRLIRGSFWKSKRARQPEETEKVRVRDIVPLRSSEEDADDHRSFDFPSPVVSNCSSWSETASSASDFLPSSVSSSENLDDVAAVAVAVENKKDSSPPSTPMPAETVAGRHRPPSKELEEEEDKEQLSPVSVMDFPYEEEEEEDDDDEEDNDLDDESSSTASPSFNQSLANIERTKLQLLQKIRRFESLAELAGVDLEARFEDLSTSGDEHQTASEDESDGNDVATCRTAETRAWVLLEELRGGPHQLGCFEKLLLDFFVQELRRSDEDDGVDVIDLSCPSRSKGAEASMLRTARDWMRGDVDGRSRDATIMEMEGNGRRRCHGEEEEEELGAELEEHVFGLLVDEMVAHLASS